MKDIIRKYALLNAVQHDGTASQGAVMGKAIAEKPELKGDMGALAKEIASVLKEVNALSPEDQKKEMEKLGPIEKPEKKQREGIPDLPNVKGKVVMRFAPNPNGPLHIGHVRQAILNDEYVKRYGGEFILRFDDTDPKTEGKQPMKEAYDWMERDLGWLGIVIGKVSAASSRLEIYYAHFGKLLEMGKAYVCTCDAERWRKMKERKEACPHREEPPAAQEERWRKMLGDCEEGKAVARIKTDICHPDPAARDWAAFRIIARPNHAKTGNTYRVWPLLDFASAIDDHEFGTTHIIRGVDLNISEVRQRFLYGYFSWEYPSAITTGKFSVKDTLMSKSKIFAGISTGDFTGWDDPRLATIMALRRRGFNARAIRNLILEVGINAANIEIDMVALEAHNRKLIDSKASRYFFVEDPHKVAVKGAPSQTVELKLHPDDAGRGKRAHKTGEEFFISGKDHDMLKKGKLYRLMDCLNFVWEGKDASFHSLAHDEYRKGGEKIMHWLPVGEHLADAEVMMPDRSAAKGVAEQMAGGLNVGDVIQFERFGFCRLDAKEGKLLKFWYTHK